MELKLVDCTVNGKCSNCGSCCSNFLPLSSEEIIRIKKYVNKHGIKEQRHNGLVGVDMTCPFRDEANRRCLIYNIRPTICRQFMCNHTTEDIMKAKYDAHKLNKVVFMRAEFFGNKEDENFLKGFMKFAADINVGSKER